jgi:acetyl-CoA synthetase
MRKIGGTNVLPDVSAWADLVEGFRWSIPAEFNMAEAAVERHVSSGRVAMVYDPGTGDPQELKFADLSRLSNRLANALEGLGVRRDDRVAIFLPQRPEVALAHLAAWKLGAISLPLTTLFGPQALVQRLGDAGPAVMIGEASSVELLRREVFGNLERPPHLLVVDPHDRALPDGATSFVRAVSEASDRRETASTRANDPAFLSFTSGTTGAAKGALHAHRTLLGHLPGFQISHDVGPVTGDRFWTPADWAWMGGFMDVLFPALYFGVPVVAAPRRFDPEEAWEIAGRHRVRNAFLPPTALRLMRQAHGPSTPKTCFRSIASGGESLGADTLDWARGALGCAINEFYGQTEINLVVSNCSALFPAKPGSMGRAVPGHEVAILDGNLDPVPAGASGEICVRADSPGAFLGYFNNLDATAQKVVGGWIVTGDAGAMDPDGHLWFGSRKDDVITSAGYRIGPSEIEECLARHPAVRLAAVVGVPDRIRTEVVKAFIELRPGAEPSADLEADIRAFVRRQLAAHLYPRLIEFIREIPLTTTGKVRRTELRQREAPPRELP